MVILDLEVMVGSLKQVIFGKCPSKSNSYKIIKIGGHCSLAKSKVLTEYERSFYAQCNLYRNRNIESFFEIEIDVFYDSMSPDLDNSMKVVMDCLQYVKAIKNDNKCMKITARKFVDKKNPRIEFVLTEI